MRETRRKAGNECRCRVFNIILYRKQIESTQRLPAYLNIPTTNNMQGGMNITRPSKQKKGTAPRLHSAFHHLHTYYLRQLLTMSSCMLEIVMQKILFTRILFNPLQRIKHLALILHNKKHRHTHRNTLSSHLRILIIQRLKHQSRPQHPFREKCTVIVSGASCPMFISICATFNFFTNTARHFNVKTTLLIPGTLPPDPNV